jgi:hypothetical protein
MFMRAKMSNLCWKSLLLLQLLFALASADETIVGETGMTTVGKTGKTTAGPDEMTCAGIDPEKHEKDLEKAKKDCGKPKQTKEYW